MLRIQSRLPDELEALVTRIIGCCVHVHRELGPGLLEAMYSKAMTLELDVQSIPFERERRVPIYYRGRLLCEHRLDLVVADSVVVELKAVERLAPVHGAQVLSYLKSSGLRIGLLVNFNQAVLTGGIKRVVS